MSDAPLTTHPPHLHSLKCWPGYFEDIVLGRKTFDLRKNDRPGGFQVGDILRIREWGTDRGYTGNETRQEITYLLDGFAGLERGYCLLVFAPERKP